MFPIIRRFSPDPFIVALLLAILVATMVPARGPFATIVDASSTIAIVALFFLHGVRLPREALIQGVTHWRLHLAILAATFVLFPLLGLGIAAAVPGLLPPPLWIGLLFLCALPSTVQSSIAFTSIAGGNVAGAVASATASNLLGIFVTPIVVGLLTQAHGGAIPMSNSWKIALQLLLPFILGNLCRPWLGDWAARNKKIMSLCDRGTIIIAVYSAFSAAVIAGLWQTLSWTILSSLLGICALLLAVALFVTRYGSRLLGFSREDEIAISFCGSKKTLASGVPMARVLFAGPDMGAVVLPLMIFHQMQLIVCAALARRYARAGRQDRAPVVASTSPSSAG
ncbi:bile acid:sodium symporter family protein [Sphingobium sp.]|uniref:bile acid:sodium symporter family protein n=1 Tax=Sphingobium TaxID=165695 RepID=UPI001A21CF2E|nr:bile acid:sodium symporter family protein [Sphingobium sp.]MBJ7375883.1 bile acid:sodium symporter [Sphingobium sp.]